MNWNIFLIISTLLVVKPTSNGLFLSSFGVEQLPVAYILVAIFAGVISTVYARLVMNISLQRIFRYTLLISIAILVGFGILLKINVYEKIILYAFYVWVAIFGLVTTSQIWITANLIFDPREAKRVFSFIGAGAIAGGIFGGYLTSFASNLIGGEDLLFMAGFMLTPCLLINQYIWKNYLLTENPIPAKASQVIYDTRRPLQILKQSRHLKLIAALVGVSVVVAKLVDYQFGGMASELISDPDELTAFFGFWFSTFSVVSLLLQLFVTKRVVGMYGVGKSLFILPVAILLSVVLILFFPSMLFAIVFLKLSDSGLKQSVNKAAMELIIFPVPQALKNKTKTFIDVFIDSLATGVTGMLLIFVIKGMDLSYQAVGFMTLLFLGGWIILANLVRKEYVKTISSRLDRLAPHEKTKLLDLSKESVYTGIQKILLQGTEKQKLYILQKLRNYRDARLIDTYEILLDSSSEKIRAETLHNLYSYRSVSFSDKILKLTRDSSRDVRLRAIEYVIRNIPEKEEIILYNLNSSDLPTWSTALIGLSKESLYNRSIASRSNLKQLIGASIKKERITESEEERIFMRSTVLTAIGLGKIQEYYAYLEEGLSESNLSIQLKAVEACGDTKSPFFFNSLLSLGSRSHGQLLSACVEAMVKYGELFIHLLREWIVNHDFNRPQKTFVIRVVRQIPNQSSIDLLFEFIKDSYTSVRWDSIRALNHLKNTHGYLKYDHGAIISSLKHVMDVHMNLLTILWAQNHIYDVNHSQESTVRRELIRLIEERLDRRLEIIFRLLGMKYPPGSMISVYKGLRSNKQDIRMSAIEMLDNLLERDLRQALLPLIETTVLEQISIDLLDQLKLPVPGEIESYEYLLKQDDERIIIEVLKLLAFKPEMKINPEIIRRLVRHTNPVISQLSSNPVLSTS
jgi:AAA family ATP:ADP antiporter